MSCGDYRPKNHYDTPTIVFTTKFHVWSTAPKSKSWGGKTFSYLFGMCWGWHSFARPAAVFDTVNLTLVLLSELLKCSNIDSEHICQVEVPVKMFIPHCSLHLVPLFHFFLIHFLIHFFSSFPASLEDVLYHEGKSRPVNLCVLCAWLPLLLQHN